MSYKKQVTVASLLEELAEARELAIKTEQPSAAIAATQTAAKLVGLWVDRKETGNPGDFAALDSVAAIVEKARADHGDAFAAAVAAGLAALDPKSEEQAEPLALPHPNSYPLTQGLESSDSASD